MTAPRVTSLRSLLLVTLIGCVVLAAPATMTHHPAAVGTAVVLGLWCLVVAAFGVLQLKQVGISSSGILAPCLVMVVGAQGVLFVMLATENQRARLRGLPLPPRNSTAAACRCIEESLSASISKTGVVPTTETDLKLAVQQQLQSARCSERLRKLVEAWVDGWGRPLRCEFANDGSGAISLRSAGEDGLFAGPFLKGDDVVVRVH